MVWEIWVARGEHSKLHKDYNLSSGSRMELRVIIPTHYTMQLRCIGQVILCNRVLTSVLSLILMCNMFQSSTALQGAARWHFTITAPDKSFFFLSVAHYCFHGNAFGRPLSPHDTESGLTNDLWCKKTSFTQVYSTFTTFCYQHFCESYAVVQKKLLLTRTIETIHGNQSKFWFIERFYERVKKQHGNISAETSYFNFIK